MRYSLGVCASAQYNLHWMSRETEDILGAAGARSNVLRLTALPVCVVIVDAVAVAGVLVLAIACLCIKLHEEGEHARGGGEEEKCYLLHACIMSFAGNRETYKIQFAATVLHCHFLVVKTQHASCRRTCC